MADESEYLQPTTVLQAVNVILGAIGQSPVASLAAGQTNVDAEQAQQRLYEANREVSGEGWHYNQEMEYEIDPNEDGEILLPLNTLKVKRIYYSGHGGDDKDLVVRGFRLYDRLGHTYNIGKTVMVDLTVVLPFEECPESARWYFTVRGARRMVGQSTQSQVSVKFTSTDEEQARLRFEQEDAELDQRTLKGNPHIQRMRRR
jgi:hypothetical protein